MTEGLTFAEDGLELHRGVYDREGLAALAALEARGPGARLHDPRLPDLLSPVTTLAARLIGEDALAVRAVLFDKTSENNWLVAWHQDRTIVVRERRDTAGFGPWSRKDGAQHVAPPIEVLSEMATFRIHIDPVGPANAPLLVAKGSHRLGKVAATNAAPLAAEHEQIVCLADAGDVWAYSTPILHASDKASKPTRRRVLQVDYAASPLPEGLEWRGVAG